MIPVMHKVAGEMLPHVIHVSARALAAQSLAISVTILTLWAAVIQVMLC